MGCEGSARRQSANSPAEQQLWSWSVRHGSTLAGRIAVTQHSTALTAHECCSRARGRRKVKPTRAWGRRAWRVWSLHGRSPTGWERLGCVAPRRSGAAAGAAFGGNLSLPWLPRRVVPHAQVARTSSVAQCRPTSHDKSRQVA
jgi:hypothetical protein